MFRLSLRQSVVAGYLLALLVCAVGWLAYETAQSATDAHAELTQTARVVAAVHEVGDRLRDAVSNQRGFLLTGDDRYLGSYRASVEGARNAMSRLRGAVSAYPAVDARVDSLGYFVGLELGELEQTMRLQRDVGTGPAIDVVRSERASEPVAQISGLLTSVESAVERHGAGGIASSTAEELLTVLGASIAAAVAVALALFIHSLYVRTMRERARVTEEMENQSYQLQIQAGELQLTNTELENATRELVEQSVEAELSEARLAGILGSATDAIVSFDDEQRIIYSNAAADRLLCAEGEKLEGQSVLDFVPARSAQSFEESMISARRAAHSRVPSPEIRDTTLTRRDATEIPVELSMAYTRSGREGIFTAILRDVSRQRQLEAEFRQAQKMEAVGRLAGGIAHDFNNLLTVIGASSDFLMYDLKGSPTEIVQDIHEIKRAADRAASLTRQLLAFSRRQLVQPQLLDINAVVAEMETMLQRLIGEDVSLNTQFADDVGVIRLDRGQLEQIVVNLVVNARDAMPGGGVVRVRTSNERVDSSHEASRGSVAGEFVTLAVSDTGIGMDDETRARIFEPFFTTKEQGRGTGLGLSTVYGIVKQFGGDIVVSSQVEVGTEFKLYFPRIDDDAVLTPAAASLPNTMRGRETILLVEDEDALRRLTRRILESRGYTVFDAPGGQDAIHLMATLHSRVDLLLTDIVMPGMSGRELVERMLPVYPWLRVLFMSGYTEDTILQHRVLELGINVLEKPFAADDLAFAVRSALARATEQGFVPAQS